MSTDEFALVRHIEAILFPLASEKRAGFAGCKFAHYASAETALKIIQSKELWLRDARCMNDFSEVIGGLNKMHGLLNDQSRKAEFLAAFNACHEGVGQDAIATFNALTNDTMQNTFISCFSQHAVNSAENDLGRLSMWRAYNGQQTGVAIIFDIPMDRVLPPINVFLSPVAYLDSIDEQFDRVVDNVKREQPFLKTLDRVILHRLIYSILLMASVALKHPGFEEEKEWRLVHTPNQFPSEFTHAETETIRGIPQTIHKLAIGKLPGVEFNSLIHRVIVGPTNFAETVKTAFITEMKKAGIADAGQRVVTSDIPLRT